MNFFSKSVAIAGMLAFSASIFIATDAHAASIKTGYTPIPGKGYTVTPTGKNALCSKPGILWNTKLIVSKAKMKHFGTYTKADAANYNLHVKNKPGKGSTYYFHAYGYQVTRSGSVYYKVVSHNGKYRGYVYGGKKLGKLTGGIKRAQATQKAPVSSSIPGDVGIATPGSLWNVVPYTQYKTKRLGMMSDSSLSTTIPQLAKFKIDSVRVRTRERDTYDHVVSQDGSHLTGWVNDRYIRHYDEILANFGIVSQSK